MMRLLCVGVVLSAVISARAIDIVGAMRSNADLTVYFDTTQAERAMSPEIWKRIQSDKGKARRRSGKKTFNTENRDAVGCVNVDFLSFAHFQFHLDGLLSVSGGKNASTRQDVRDFAAAFRELGYEVTESGGKKKPSCRASMTADGEHPDSGAEIVSENEGSLRIKAYWGVKEQDVAAARQKESRLADLLNDPMQVAQWQLVYGMGNLMNFQDAVWDYSAWTTLSQMRNTTSTDLAFRFDKHTNKLYTNISSGTPDSITVEYIPQIQDVEEITSDYWTDMLMRLSVALTKVTIGRIRTRYTQSNALWQQDGDVILSEGREELTSLRETLLANSELCYPID